MRAEVSASARDARFLCLIDFDFRDGYTLSVEEDALATWTFTFAPQSAAVFEHLIWSVRSERVLASCKSVAQRA